MEAATVISTIVTVIETLAKLEPTFVATWDNLKPFAETLYTNLTGGTISDEDLATLEAKVDDLHNKLQQPLDPE